jgi:hypothetical protein
MDKLYSSAPVAGGQLGQLCRKEGIGLAITKWYDDFMQLSTSQAQGVAPN